MIVLADLLYYIIPDTMVIILSILTITYRVILVSYGEMQLNDLLWAAGSTAVVASFFVALWFFSKGKGMGLGDAKLMVPLGLLLGWPSIIVGVFFAFVAGAVVGLSLIVTGKKRFGQVIPFGPFLIVGACVALVWGDQIINWYLRLLL